VKEEAARRQAKISATATPEEGAAAETTKVPQPQSVKLAAPGSDEVNRSVQTEATQPEAVNQGTEQEATEKKETPKSSTQLTLKPDQAKPLVDFARSIPDSEVFH